jgi:hypothetical protein
LGRFLFPHSSYTDVVNDEGDLPLSNRIGLRRWMRIAFVLLLIPVVLIIASIIEMVSGLRLLPYSAYRDCGGSVATTLPDTVRIGLYEEFPVAWRLNKLALVDFPVSLAIAAPSRAEFMTLRAAVVEQYPQVETVYFWGTLAAEAGYYPGAWSDSDSIQRLAHEAEDLPTLWDAEMPLNLQGLSALDWQTNRAFISNWLRQRVVPVHIWRSHPSMGLNPLFLRWMGLHFDPNEYPNVYLHLNLYTTGAGQPEGELRRVLRCGVEQYGERFIPSLGVLNDGEGANEIFIPVETLRRNLHLARAAGVSEIWLFGVNGLNEDYLDVIRETIPVE